MNTHYLNTDLDLKSNEDISELGTYFDRCADLIHCEKEEEDVWSVIVDAAGSGTSELPEADILDLISIIEKMDPSLKSLLEACHVKDFNIGIETGDTHGFNIPVNHSTLNKIAILGFTLSLTTYPMSDV